MRRAPARAGAASTPFGRVVVAMSCLAPSISTKASLASKPPSASPSPSPSLATTNARDASFNVLRCGGASAPSRAAEISSASIAFLRARFASASALAAATRSRSTSAAASFTAASRAACSAGSVGLALAALDAVGDFFFAAAAAVAGGAF